MVSRYTQAELEHLEVLYNATDYKVMFGTGEVFILRVGETCLVADEILRERGQVVATFITPENPASQVLTDDENYARCVSFERALAGAGYSWLHGTSEAHGGNWPVENGYFVAGMDDVEARRFAHAFGQNAVVMYELGKTARLLWALPFTHK